MLLFGILIIIGEGVMGYIGTRTESSWVFGLTIVGAVLLFMLILLVV